MYNIYIIYIIHYELKQVLHIMEPGCGLASGYTWLKRFHLIT